MKHDYAATFAKIEKAKMSASSLTKADCLDDEYETIRHALRFAEKMCQEPSIRQCQIGQQVLDSSAEAFEEQSDAQYKARDIYKAMRDQAIKELGE